MGKIAYFFLALVVLGSFLIRLWHVGDLPSILNRDEAALAYNGLLLEQAGVDEWGKHWPITLESFGDYKLPGYPYLLAILFSLFPESDVVVRLPSVLAGSILPLLIYLLSRRFKLSKLMSVMAAIIVASSYIFFFFSRIAFEANVALAMFIGAIVLFLSDKPSWKSDLIGAGLILLSMFFYNSPLILTPVIMIAIVLWRGVTKYHRWAVAVGSLAFVFLSMLIILLPVIGQKNGITIFTDETINNLYPQFRSQFPGLLSSMFGNQYVYYGKLMLIRMLASFGPVFLVIQGGEHPWHSVSGWGHYNWLIYALFVMSLFWLGYRIINRIVFHLKSKSLSKKLASAYDNSSLGRATIVLLLLASSLLPAAITVDAPHTTRSLLYLALMPIVIAVASRDFIYWISNRFDLKFKQLSIGIVTIVSCASLIFFGLYLFEYFNDYVQRQQRIFQAGFDNTVQMLEKDYKNKPIAIVDPTGYQYILLSWYLKIPANEYLQSNVRQQPDKIGFRYGERVGRYHFIADADDRTEESVLVFWNGYDWQVQTY